MQTCTVTFKDGTPSKHIMCPNNTLMTRKEAEFIVVTSYGSLSGILINELWVRAEDVHSVNIRDVAVTGGTAIGGN